MIFSLEGGVVIIIFSSTIRKIVVTVHLKHFTTYLFIFSLSRQFKTLTSV